MRPVMWTAEDTETLQTLLAEGKSCTEISHHIGFSPSRVQQAAAEIGQAFRASDVWKDPAKIERLKQLFAEGYSASAIAARIGGVSRNGVIGKLHRMGLRRSRNQQSLLRALNASRTAKKQRRSLAAKKGASTRRAALNARLAERLPVVIPVAPETAPPNATPLLDLRADQCRFPYGDKDFLFCAETKMTGSSFCIAHHHRCYQPLVFPRQLQ